MGLGNPLANGNFDDRIADLKQIARNTAKNTDWPRFAVFAVVGVTADFLIVGVLKFIWFAIYAPCYLALAMTFGSFLLRSRFQSQSVVLPLGFLLGAALSHGWFMDHQAITNYPMRLDPETQSQLVVLASDEFTERLYIVSKNLEAQTAGRIHGELVNVAAATRTDYGCLKDLLIVGIGGVDVAQNPEDRWNWRSTPIGVREPEGLPPLYKHPLPWCGLHLDQLSGM